MRSLNRIAMGAVVVLAGLSLLERTRGAGAAPPEAPADATFARLTVAELRVGGPNGPAVTIGADASGRGTITLAHADGTPAAVLTVDAKGAGLTLRTAGGATCVRLRADAPSGPGGGPAAGAGGGTLEIASADGSPAVQLASDADGGLLEVCNRHDQAVGRLMADEDGAGVTHVLRADGQRGVESGSDEAGGYVATFQGDEHGTAFVGGAQAGGKVEVLRKAGGAGAGLYVGAADGGYVQANTSTGRLSAYLGTSKNRDAGLLHIYDAGGQLLLGAGAGTHHVALYARRTGGQLELRTPAGRDGVLAGIGDTGGGVNLFDTAGKRTVVQSR